jgi:hypothetical protein
LIETSENRPPGHLEPQIITEGVLHRSARSDVITFKLRVLRIVELSFIVPIPRGGRGRVPVYVRFYLDKSQEDKPGSVVIE